MVRSRIACSFFVSTAAAGFSLQFLTSRYANQSVDPMAFDLTPNGINSESGIHLGTKLPAVVGLLSTAGGFWVCSKKPPTPPKSPKVEPSSPTEKPTAPAGSARTAVRDSWKAGTLVFLGGAVVILGAAITQLDGPLIPVCDMAGLPVILYGTNIIKGAGL